MTATRKSGDEGHQLCFIVAVRFLKAGTSGQNCHRYAILKFYFSISTPND